jgi:hypothetical protein
MTKSKGRRQRKNENFYKLLPEIMKKKKAAKATKKAAKKAANIKKDVKKNGKPVKGGKTYLKKAAEKAAQIKAEQEAACVEANAEVIYGGGQVESNASNG